MKKIILLFVLTTFLFTSCSSDDSSSSQDQLIGFWTSFQRFLNNTEIPLDECDKMDNIRINANGTFNEEYFFNDSGTCVSDGTDNGLWENMGNSIYQITYDIGTPDEEVLLVTIIFSNNTFIIETTDGTDSYREVYVRN